MVYAWVVLGVVLPWRVVSGGVVLVEVHVCQVRGRAVMAAVGA